MPNNKSHGSPYKMKAGKMGPMQKNFGPELAINKTLDKKSMPGGMTGQPGKELDGPMAKKFRLFKKPTAAQQAKRDKLKSDVKSFGKGLKKAGEDAGKKIQKAGKYMSAKSVKARRTARKNKKNGESSLGVGKDGNLNYNTTTKNSNIKAPKVEPKTKSNVKVKKRTSYASAYKNADKKKYKTLASFTEAAKKYNSDKKKKKN